ncbi:hypothetical protein [Pseudodesulfovibrio piezophilus]|uniref:Uncharacterized protein n=1 Tax=Pseudodesulfovibrio piezophilus (strain DSM 21447 / JCM 15486 / C1TLV30) TaxID=1322246 RepID=M1WLD2_PSEP2|nr:hypothetical protein [Pseudodesulfovibrio piezophilus]CCH47660.1 conserved protein of unknown function [Pseudodesulfovibrio piezophilus C1TLV30]
MSEIGITTSSMSSMALENQAAGAESIQESSSTVISGLNKEGSDSHDRAMAGAEVVSRSTEFFGAGTHLGSTGTEIDTAQAINSTLIDGGGSITNRIA